MRCTTPAWTTSRCTWWSSCSTFPATVTASPTSGPRSGWMLEGRITREERYHRVDSVRSCLDTQDLPSGWWETLSPRAARVTGTVTVAGNEVIVWNGTPQREALLGWALQRFADAGLPAPAPTSVTFLPPVADPWTAYGFEPGAPDLVLPSTSEGCDPEGCDVWPTVDRTFSTHRTGAHLGGQRHLVDPAQCLRGGPRAGLGGL